MSIKCNLYVLVLAALLAISIAAETQPALEKPSEHAGPDAESSVEATTESPLADMSLIDTALKMPQTEPLPATPTAQRHTVADFIIHPLIAFKPRAPPEEPLAAGKQASSTSTTPSPWHLFGLNTGAGLGSSVSSLAGSVTGWLNDRIQLPGLVESPVRESTSTSSSTTTTTTLRPDIVVRVQHRSTTRRPLININNKNRPQRFYGNGNGNFDSGEFEDDDDYDESYDDDDEDDFDFDYNRRRQGDRNRNQHRDDQYEFEEEDDEDEPEEGNYEYEDEDEEGDDSEPNKPTNNKNKKKNKNDQNDGEDEEEEEEEEDDDDGEGDNDNDNDSDGDGEGENEREGQGDDEAEQAYSDEEDSNNRDRETNNNNNHKQQADSGDKQQKRRPNNRFRPVRRRNQQQQHQQQNQAGQRNRNRRNKNVRRREDNMANASDNDQYYYELQSAKRSQTNPNFIQRGQQSLIKQLRQLTRGQSPAEIGQAMRKSQKAGSKKRRKQATLYVNRNGQTVYMAPELLEPEMAALTELNFMQPQYVTPVQLMQAAPAFPQPPLTMPLKRQGRPTQYITIPWTQLGIAPPEQVIGIAEGMQSQPLILNIPQSAINSMQSPSGMRKKQRPSLTADAVPLLAEASIMEIFEPPKIPPSRGSPKPSAKPAAANVASLPHRIRPGTIVEKAPEMPAPSAGLEDGTNASSMDQPAEAQLSAPSNQYILVGEEESSEQSVARQAYPFRYYGLPSRHRGRFAYRKKGRALDQPDPELLAAPVSIADDALIPHDRAPPQHDQQQQQMEMDRPMDKPMEMEMQRQETAATSAAPSLADAQQEALRLAN